MSRQNSTPSNLHLSAFCPAGQAPGLMERVEQKYFITPQRTGIAFALLRRTCRPDPEYPSGQINSLYFDTADLEQHERSLSGESTKNKVRIRWYGEECDPHTRSVQGTDSGEELIRVWLELKSRRGFAATKQRLSLEVGRRALTFSELAKGIVPAGLLMQTMAGFGFFPRGPLHPVVVISYRRHRFVEPRTGFRISIDSHIRSSMVMPGRGIGERGLVLPGMVVEVKGPRFELPPALRRLADTGSSWTRYSKYSSSLDGHQAGLGSVSRLWPSGMMEKRPGTLTRVDQDGGKPGQTPVPARENE